MAATDHLERDEDLEQLDLGLGEVLCDKTLIDIANEILRENNAIDSAAVAGHIVSSADSTPDTSPANASPHITKADGSSSDELCPVCLCQASEYRYYGARSCQSCRAFFRRAVQKPGGHTTLKCRGTGNCTVDSQSWRSCRSCRFQRCLRAGMNPRWVLNDEEKRRRAQRLEKVRRQRHEVGVEGRDLLAEWLCQLPDLVTNQELEAIVHLARTRFDIFCSEIKTFLLCHPNHLRNLLLCRRQCRGRALPMAAVLSFDALFTHLHHRFIETAVNCPGLVESDRRTLLHHNCRVLVSLGHSIHVPVNGVNAIAVGKVVELIQRNFAEDGELAGLLRDLSLDDGEGEECIRGVKLTYEQFYPPSWVGDPELERRHKQNGARAGAWFDGHPDQVQFFLLSMLILFSPLFLDLEAPAVVESTQLTYARALHRYLRCKMKIESGAAKKLGDGMMILSMARESHQIKELGYGS